MLGGREGCRYGATRPAATAGSSCAKQGKALEDQGSHGGVHQPGLQRMSSYSSAWPLTSWVSLGKPLPFSS